MNSRLHVCPEISRRNLLFLEMSWQLTVFSWKSGNNLTSAIFKRWHSQKMRQSLGYFRACVLYYISHIYIGIVTHAYSSYARLFLRRSRMNSRLHVCLGAEYRISVFILEISRRNFLLIERSWQLTVLVIEPLQTLSGGILSRFSNPSDIIAYACFII